MDEGKLARRSAPQGLRSGFWEGAGIGCGGSTDVGGCARKGPVIVGGGWGIGDGGGMCFGVGGAAFGAAQGTWLASDGAV